MKYVEVDTANRNVPVRGVEEEEEEHKRRLKWMVKETNNEKTSSIPKIYRSKAERLLDENGSKSELVKIANLNRKQHRHVSVDFSQLSSPNNSFDNRRQSIASPLSSQYAECEPMVTAKIDEVLMDDENIGKLSIYEDSLEKIEKVAYVESNKVTKADEIVGKSTENVGGQDQMTETEQIIKKFKHNAKRLLDLENCNLQPPFTEDLQRKNPLHRALVGKSATSGNLSTPDENIFRQVTKC